MQPVSRRSVLALAAAGFVPWRRLLASGSEFWNKKDPSQWTSEEIDQLTSKSPWAKEVNAQYAAGSEDEYGRGTPGGGGGGYPGGGGGTIGMPRIGIGVGGIGIGMPRGRGGMGGGRNGGGRGRGGGTSTYKGTVRWESSQPILDALKNPPPEAFALHYVLSVRGFPLLADRRRSAEDDADSAASSQRMLDDLKQFTTLQPRGKALAQPGIVQQVSPSTTAILFGFSKDLFDFGKDDREVDFSTRIGRLLVKARFDLKEMIYHGKLAV